MIQAACPGRATEPKAPREPHTKTLTLAQQKAGFTAEGAPPLDPTLPAAGPPVTPEKALLQTPPPPAPALARLLSGSHRI